MLVFLALVPLLSLAAGEDVPLKRGHEADIVAEIKAAQKKYIRESSGEYDYECFTTLNYQQFKAAKMPQKIAEAMRSNREFMEGVIALCGKPAAERAAFVKSCRRALRPTWAELGRITPEGQTEAGNSAELDIANGIADMIEELVKLPAEKIDEIFRKR